MFRNCSATKSRNEKATLAITDVIKTHQELCVCGSVEQSQRRVTQAYRLCKLSFCNQIDGRNGSSTSVGEGYEYRLLIRSGEGSFICKPIKFTFNTFFKMLM